MSQLNTDLYLGDPYIEEPPADYYLEQDAHDEWLEHIAELRELEGADS